MFIISGVFVLCCHNLSILGTYFSFDLNLRSNSGNSRVDKGFVWECCTAYLGMSA